jgi:hypothetical protein
VIEIVLVERAGTKSCLVITSLSPVVILSMFLSGDRLDGTMAERPRITTVYDLLTSEFSLSEFNLAPCARRGPMARQPPFASRASAGLISRSAIQTAAYPAQVGASGNRPHLNLGPLTFAGRRVVGLESLLHQGVLFVPLQLGRQCHERVCPGAPVLDGPGKHQRLLHQVVLPAQLRHQAAQGQTAFFNPSQSSTGLHRLLHHTAARVALRARSLTAKGDHPGCIIPDQPRPGQHMFGIVLQACAQCRD